MNPSVPCFVSCLAVVAAGLLVAPQATGQQIQHQITQVKPNYELQQTPQFSVSGPKDKRSNPLEWLEVEVELDLETKAPSGYIDQLDAEFFIGVKDTNDNGKPVLLTGKMSFVEVRAKEKKAWLIAYVSPAALTKTTGKDRPNKSDIQAVAVTVSGPGLRAPVTESVGARDKWWEATSLKRQDGLVLAKSKTPFAWLWSDRYPMTKEER